MIHRRPFPNSRNHIIQKAENGGIEMRELTIKQSLLPVDGLGAMQESVGRLPKSIPRPSHQCRLGRGQGVGTHGEG
jgi:hypothetical protein